MSRISTTVMLSIAVSFSTGCERAPHSGADVPAAQEVVNAPAQSEDGWTTGTLNEHGIKAEPIAAMLRAIHDSQFTGISSVVLVRDGVLVLDEYFGDYKRDSIHNTSSAAKSITSALVGIAIDQGFIPSVNVPILPYFPEYNGVVQQWDPRKEAIRLADVLSMSSGMKCDEDAMYDTDDWIKFYLDQPMFAAPGTAFSYNTCGVVALGNVITKASGLRIPAFADRFLFEPMGVTAVKWPITNSLGSQGLAMTGGGLRLRPRDMAKFGQLYLDDGVWRGQRLISSEWIDESTRKHSTSDLYGEDYGFLWRMIDRDRHGIPVRSYEAWGNGGQYIMVFPDLALVVVFTGENYGQFPAMEQPFVLVDEYILPAVQK